MTTTPRQFAMLLGVLTIAAGVARAETNIAVLDVARVFEAYEMTRDLEAAFDERRREAANEAERRRGNIEQMRRALAAFDPESEDFARREQELVQAEVEFQVWSAMQERTLKNDHKRWLKHIYRRTQDTIAEIAGERDIDLVLTYDALTEDAPDSAALRQQILLQKVIFHDEKIDITDAVLQRLNKAYRDEGGAQSLTTPPDEGNRDAKKDGAKKDGGDASGK